MGLYCSVLQYHLQNNSQEVLSLSISKMCRFNTVAFNICKFCKVLYWSISGNNYCERGRTNNFDKVTPEKCYPMANNDGHSESTNTPNNPTRAPRHSVLDRVPFAHQPRLTASRCTAVFFYLQYILRISGVYQYARPGLRR